MAFSLWWLIAAHEQGTEYISPDAEGGPAGSANHNTCLIAIDPSLFSDPVRFLNHPID
jgi:hypothetical protein